MLNQRALIETILILNRFNPPVINHLIQCLPLILAYLASTLNLKSRRIRKAEDRYDKQRNESPIIKTVFQTMIWFNNGWSFACNIQHGSEINEHGSD